MKYVNLTTYILIILHCFFVQCQNALSQQFKDNGKSVATSNSSKTLLEDIQREKEGETIAPQKTSDTSERIQTKVKQDEFFNNKKYFKQNHCTELDWITFEVDDNNKIIKTITQELNKMYENRDEHGVFQNSNILDARSMILQESDNKRLLTSENIMKYDDITLNEKKRRERCYMKSLDSYKWQESSAETKTEISLIKSELKKLKADLEYYEVEQKNILNMFKSRLTSLRQSYLVFVCAFSLDEIANNKIMKNNFDSIAINKLQVPEVKHFIDLKLAMHDQFAEYVIQKKNIAYKIEKSYSSPIELMPINGQRAHIQKYIVEVSNSENLDNIKKGISECTDSYIIVGNESLELLQKEAMNHTICDNLYKQLVEFANSDKKLININSKVEYIKGFIKETIDENASMIHQYNQTRISFKEFMIDKNLRLTEYMRRVNQLKKNISKIVDYTPFIIDSYKNSKNDSTPNFLKNKKILDFIQSELDKIDKYFAETIDIPQRKVENQNQFESFLLIENKEEIRIEDTISKHIEKKYYQKLKEISKLREPIVESSDKPYNYIPRITHFFIPFFRIEAVPNSFEKEYAIGIALKGKYKRIETQYDFNSNNSQIKDVLSSQIWHITKKQTIPFMKCKTCNEFDPPPLKDYLDFCTNYNKFMDKYGDEPNYKDWPKIDCLKRFDYIAKDKIFIDNVSQEKWKRITTELSFNETKSNVRGEAWKIVSYEKMKDFLTALFEYQEEVKKLPIEYQSYEVNMDWKKNFIENYWSITVEGEKIKTIKYNKKKNIFEDSLLKKNEKACSLIYQDLKEDQ